MRTFRFRLIPFVATALLVALGIVLGQWQDGRAAEKTALQAKLDQRSASSPLALGAQLLDPEAADYRKVSATGEFVAGWPVFMNNRPQAGRVGLYLVMPLRLAGTNTHVLVARGWLARPTGASGVLPEFATPGGTVTVTGVARGSMGRVMELGTPAPVAPKAIVQNLDVAQFAQASGLELQPFFIEQTDPVQPGDKLLRDWPAPALNVEKHQGYAFQWYALAVMALLFFVITGFRRGPEPDPNQ
ncbi:SURF1 family protein [Massilia cavernae]|uniref:SURF1-like protein n=1 Tax=Massilia cavernae TaxID=2320864 RepID=A0A418XT77_9BURK|nr:SURF1 family protein [Massilia cavernae]RJG15788.1 SURF1 family protein [Massilia cavernae]